MLRVLLSRRWLAALLAAAAFATVAFFLGRWQWNRYEEKVARAERITSAYDASPVPVGTVLGEDPLPRAREWTRVSAEGRYAVGTPLLVRNRPLDGTYGYEVLVPLRLTDGQVILVNRGWVPNSPRGAAVAPDFAPAPTDEVSLSGWLRPSERSLGRRLPPGQLASIQVDEAEAQLGKELLGGYLVLGAERVADGSTPERPRPLPRPDTALGPHQAYAFQWWGSMPVGFVLVFFGVRRELRDAGHLPHPVPRPKRTRIWDEEDY